jgi:hypothetical protein
MVGVDVESRVEEELLIPEEVSQSNRVEAMMHILLKTYIHPDVSHQHDEPRLRPVLDLHLSSASTCLFYPTAHSLPILPLLLALSSRSLEKPASERNNRSPALFPWRVFHSLRRHVARPCKTPPSPSQKSMHGTIPALRYDTTQRRNDIPRSSTTGPRAMESVRAAFF